MLTLLSIKKNKQLEIGQNNLSWEILLINRGNGIVKDSKGAIGIMYKPGDVIIIPPQLEHGWYNNDDVDTLSIMIDKVSLPNHSIYCIEQSPNHLLSSTIEQCYHFFVTLDGLHRGVNIALLDLLVNCIVEFIDMHIVYSPIVEKIYRAISNHYNDPNFNITQIMKKKMNNSPEYLRKLFLQEVGLTPAQLTRNLQMELAHKLVVASQGDISVLELAHNCGIVDQFYFSRIFRSYFQCSPKQYIKNYTQDVKFIKKWKGRHTAL